MQLRHGGRGHIAHDGLKLGPEQCYGGPGGLGIGRQQTTVDMHGPARDIHGLALNPAVGCLVPRLRLRVDLRLGLL